MFMHKRFVAISIAILIGGSLFAVYWVGLHGAFFFDDLPNILHVPAIRIEHLSFDAIRGVIESGKSGPLGRPIPVLSFAFNYYVGGFDPFGYKLVNLGIHLVNGLFLVVLFNHLLSTVKPQLSSADAMLVSVVLATIWLFHPLQLTSVLYVVQRMNSLSALFMILALIFHIRSREANGSRWQLFVAWCVFWPMSLLSKENGVLFPLFVVTWEMIIRRALVGRIDRTGVGIALIAGFASLAAIVYLFSPIGLWWLSGYAQRPFGLAERLMTEGRVIWQYIGLTVLPQLESLGLHHDDLAISKGLLQPWTTLVSLAGIAALVAFGFAARTYMPLVSFGIFWFLIGHSLESSFIPLEIMHEHRNYLPMVGLVLVGGSLLREMVVIGGKRKRWALVLACVFLAYLMFVTSLRSHQFGDELRRTQVEGQHHRGSARSQYEAGRVFAALPLAADGDSMIHAIARAHFERSNEADPNFKLGFLGLISLECMATKSVSSAIVVELTKRFESTPFAPGDNSVLFSIKEMALAKALCLSRIEVESLFAAAVNNSSGTLISKLLALSWLADYFWLVERDLAATQKVLEDSLLLAPWYPNARLKLAQIHLLNGEINDAIKLLRDLEGVQLSVEEAGLRRELMDGLAMPLH